MPETKPERGVPGSTGTGWTRDVVGPLAGLFVLAAAAAAYEIAPASLVPLIRESLGVDAASVSLLVSVMLLAGVLGSIPAGVVLDRVSVRPALAVVVAGLVVSGLAGWVAGAVGAYWWLVGSRVLGGLCFVGIWNAGANVVGRIAPPDRRGTAVGVFTASGPAGFALGQFGSPLLAARLGWPAAMAGFTTLGAVGGAIFLVSTRGRSLAVEAETPDLEAVRVLVRNRSLWVLSGLCSLGYLLYMFVNSWLPSYLVHRFGVTLALAGLLTAVFPAIGVVSRTGGGLISDRLFGGRRRPVTLLGFGLAAPGVALVLGGGQVAVVVAGVLLAGFAVQLVIGLLFSYVTEVVAPTVRVTALSVLTSVGLSGAFVAPLAGGVVIDRAGYRPAFLLAVGVALLGLVLAWRAPEA